MKSVKVMRSLLIVPALAMTAACGGEGDSNVSKQLTHSGGVAPNGVVSKFDPPITITSVRSVTPTWKFPEGDSIDNNIWLRDIQSKYGIIVKYKWTAATAQYPEKFNVTLASGDFPDFGQVTAEQLQKLIKDDQVADLTGVYDKYASPILKEILNQDGGKQMQSATIKGKLLALPRTIAPINVAPVLWIRTDWLQKLNLKEPKTMQDVLAIAEAFAKNDPDGNGKPDTYGMVIHKNLFGGGAGALEGFFDSYHAYPNIWIKDKAGKLSYGSIQPEMKAALQKLQDMFKSGLIDPEFGVKDSQKISEFVAQGKSGLHFGTATDLSSLQQFRDADPKADWYAFPLVSIDDKPVLAQSGFTGITYYAVNKKYKNPEALVFLFNNYVENMWGKGAKPEFIYAPDGQPVFSWAPINIAPFRKNLNAYLNVNEALKSGNVSSLNAEEKDYYDRTVKFKAGDNKFFGAARVFGEKGAFSVIDTYLKNNRTMFDEFIGAATPGMAQKMASLNTLQLTTFTKIIMNAASIDDFDKFVVDWKKLGGDQITKEVNDWYTEFKK